MRRIGMTALAAVMLLVMTVGLSAAQPGGEVRGETGDNTGSGCMEDDCEQDSHDDCQDVHGFCSGDCDIEPWYCEEDSNTDPDPDTVQNGQINNAT